MPPTPSTQSTSFLDEYLPYLMTRAAGRVSERLHNQLDRQGMAVPVWRALAALLDHHGRDTVNGLSDTCMTLQPTMSKLLQRMEGDGLLRREAHPQDRRVVMVSLTDEGTRQAEALSTTALQFEQDALAGVPASELAVMKAVARQLTRRNTSPSAGPGQQPW